MHGVLQWVLRPVYTLAYFIQRLIRRVRAAIDYYNAGYHVLTQNGSEDLGPLSSLHRYMVQSCGRPYCTYYLEAPTWSFLKSTRRREV